MPGCAFVDGQYVAPEDAKISIFDWGFLHSDATYDVAHVWQGKFFRLDDHLDRFFASLDRLRLDPGRSREQVRALFPNMDIRLSQANGAVVISGSIPPAMMKQVETVVQAAGYKTVNLIGQSVEHIAQVQLSVKVAEVSRNKLSEFAYAPVYQPSAGKGVYTNTGSGPYSVGRATNAVFSPTAAAAARSLLWAATSMT